MVLFELRTPEYACAGLLDDRVITAYPFYERRSWVLRQLNHPGFDGMLFVGARPVGCGVDPGLCVAAAPGIWRIPLGNRSPLEVAKSIGLIVRAF